MSLAAVFFPTLKTIETRFEIERSLKWVQQNWKLSIYASVAYLVVVFALKKWMENRKPYNLRRCLIVWNASLAVFSIFGASCLLPEMLRNIFSKGLTFACCYNETSTLVIPHMQLWGWLFSLSKIVELGDTLFIVLRKTPLTFLHWYHHITVLVFCWYAVTTPNASAHFYATMNYCVHSIMYSYYMAKASGWTIPSKVPLFITVVQIVQMFLGILVNITIINAKVRGIYCFYSYDLMLFSGFIYFSYAILFIKFFVQRYFRN